MNLRVAGLSVHYGARTAVEPTDLVLEPGQLVALVGPNGAGKSSLLKALAGVVDYAGGLFVGSRPIADLGPRDRARLVAYLAQNTAAHWPVEVGELVGLGRLPHRGFGQAPGPGDREAVSSAMTRTGITELAARSVATLSGGEFARVQLARALAVQAPILLADEPVAALDPFHQLEIMAELERYAADERLVVVVMHDLSLAARFCHRMLLLHSGGIVADGTPAEVLQPETLERFYRVRPYVSEYEGQTVVIPWQTVE